MQGTQAEGDLQRETLWKQISNICVIYNDTIYQKNINASGSESSVL